ncbi:hypothetical protein BWD42_07790 [Sphingobacterium sp. CZ-UAM]|uniref:CBM96 family carbohydrate-binding protein n=1 Tax=Sphingobacterium sp. CZ-UAM TaxID=1933868 RepID=UPI0009845054|nr:DNRLRE domain-containing protein [Sphingobacterium sp. CZ-UAM]OOG19790.1 hypothetical protein BWD42_07790 [Sphingobacterium sp. CZ-UAM]
MKIKTALIATCISSTMSLLFVACRQDELMDAKTNLLSNGKASLSEGLPTLTASADAYVRDGNYANNNYGAETSLAVKSDQASFKRKSYIKFDLTSVQNLGISSARLSLNVRQLNTSLYRTVNVYAVKTNTWDEKTINWNNAPMDTVHVGKLRITGTGHYSLDVTKAIKNQVGAVNQQVTFLLLNTGPANSTGDVSFSSRELADRAPQLVFNSSEKDSTDVDKLLAKYNLVWNDEFEGATMDQSKWSYRAEGTVRKFATVNNAKTISLDGNGNMVVKAIREGDKYYVGQISTDGHFNPTYGYFECRAKMNTKKGPHVAFWLQSPSIGSTPYDNPAVNGAEVDIFEYLRNTSGLVHQTIHYNGYTDPYHKSSQVSIPYPEVDNGYHTFGLLWTDTSYTFFIDGYKTRETNFGLSKRSEYMILSTELTGWGGPPPFNLPDSVLFDYVRVYQPK